MSFDNKHMTFLDTGIGSVTPGNFTNNASQWGTQSLSQMYGDGNAAGFMAGLNDPSRMQSQALPINGSVWNGDGYSFMPKESASKTNWLDPQGKWVQGAQLGLGALQIGAGIYSAVQQSKMNEFMRSYYKDQMSLQRADYTNTARAANEALAGKQERILSARGYATDSPEMQQGVSNYMSKWGAKETF